MPHRCVPRAFIHETNCGIKLVLVPREHQQMVRQNANRSQCGGHFYEAAGKGSIREISSRDGHFLKVRTDFTGLAGEDQGIPYFLAGYVPYRSRSDFRMISLSYFHFKGKMLFMQLVCMLILRFLNF